jgi:Protein of unknown function (DUF664)
MASGWRQSGKKRLRPLAFSVAGRMPSSGEVVSGRISNIEVTEPSEDVWIRLLLPEAVDAPGRREGQCLGAAALLNFNRESVLKKTDGLDEEQLRRALVPTDANLLDLVKHLAAAERYWFGPLPHGWHACPEQHAGDEGSQGTYRRGGDQRLPRGHRREQHGDHRSR